MGKYKNNDWVNYLTNEKVDTVEKLKNYVKETLNRDIIVETVKYYEPSWDLDHVSVYLK